MTNYYIDPANGSNSNSGTSVSAAWEDFSPLDPDNGSAILTGGDSVYVRGTATIDQGQVDLSGYSGSSGNRILVTNYQDESPTIDANRAGSHGVLLDNTSHLTFENFQVRNAENHNIRGNSSTKAHVHNCEVTRHGSGGDFGAGINFRQAASSPTVTNCEIYDGQAGGNADGIVAVDGTTNFRCRDTVIHDNPDDGVDLQGSTAEGPHASGSDAADVRRVLTYRLGNSLDGSSSGNGDGFKTGNTEFSDGGHTFVRCVSYNNAGNGGRGFEGIAADQAMTLLNCAFVGCNGVGIDLRNSQGAAHEVTNCVSQDHGSWDLLVESGANVTTCNWDGTQTGKFNASDGSGTILDFRSRDVSSGDFLRLPSGSPAIEAGTDVGLSYNGDAPDWGRYEFSSSTEPSGSAVLRVYDGSAWKRAPANYYDGNQFVSL